ncbi:MAG: succinyl-diaminopimelate desuccinylase [Acidimicrobiales bacterium]
MSRLDDALEIVQIDSVSGRESALAEFVERRLRENPLLDVERIGDNVVARTTGHHATRLMVAGHLDTVPGDPGAAAIVGDELRGVGACDMKGSIAVMLELATEPVARSTEVSWLFYAREEIARNESGLLEVAELRPELLTADVAVLCEPTGGAVEAGCQGAMRVGVELHGVRAHTARPYTGVNAIHRLASLVDHVAHYEPRAVDIDGVTFVEQLQTVSVQGGVAPNVVPDLASCVLNYRVAPDRSEQQALAWLTKYLGDFVAADDSVRVIDWAPSAAPALSNARLAHLVTLTNSAPRAKLGWTDVATFAQMGIPAANFGAGDPLFAHRSDERVTRDELDEFAHVLRTWLA